MQSLIGLLRFACSVVGPGPAFLRRVPDLLCGVKNFHHNIRLICEAGADLHTWHSFNQHYNGKFILLSSRWLPVSSDDYLTLFIDASRPVGFVAVFGEKWFAPRFDKAQFYSVFVCQLRFSSHTCAMWYIHKVLSIANPTESFFKKKNCRVVTS